MFYWSQKHCKLSATSLEFTKKILVTWNKIEKLPIYMKLWSKIYIICINLALSSSTTEVIPCTSAVAKLTCDNPKPFLMSHWGFLNCLLYFVAVSILLNMNANKAFHDREKEKKRNREKTNQRKLGKNCVNQHNKL